MTQPATETENQPLPQSKHDWNSIREWLNVAAALGALFVGIVSFWTTARISGLEDYLRSEIGRRNSELNSLSDKTDSLEKVAEERAERLSTLQASTDEIIAASILAQRRFSDTQSELNKVRFEINAAERTLDSTKREQKSAEVRFEDQADRFDLFKRRQTYQITSIEMVFQSIYYGNDEDGFTGEEASKAMLSFSPPQGDEQLIPYFEMLKTNFPKVCPYFRAMKANLPPISKKPDTPTITYRVGASREHIAALTKVAQDKWSEEWKAWSASMDANAKVKSEWVKRIIAESEICTCRALVDERHPQAMICPTAKPYQGPADN